MSSREEMNIKEICIDLLDIADLNFLSNLQGLEPKDVDVKANADINSIKTIVQHCARQMDRTISNYDGSRLLKDNIEYSFKELIEIYLQISAKFFGMLDSFSVESFYDNQGGTGEILYKRIERISLHYLGHTGQIVIIRKMLGRGIAGPYGFVKAMSKPTRKKIRKEWTEWWEANKNRFTS
ncbi:MAG: hypothetical protein ACTSQF_01775 [Candidatus Heimdallarchaeaceae archaeon]